MYCRYHLSRRKICQGREEGKREVIIQCTKVNLLVKHACICEDGMGRGMGGERE